MWTAIVYYKDKKCLLALSITEASLYKNNIYVKLGRKKSTNEIKWYEKI